MSLHSAMRKIKLQKGDVLWLETPQSLSPIRRAEQLSSKVRPFVAIRPCEIAVDHNGNAEQDRPIFGATCTSKKFLVAGRPHLSFEMNKPTYVMMDSVRDISSAGQNLQPDFTLDDDEIAELDKALDEVLRPERKFFLRDLFNFKKSIMPGQVHNIETIDSKGPALILLRRGDFVANDNVECSDDFDAAVHDIKKTPYLVLYFHNTQWKGTLRGIHPSNLRITAIHEDSIHERLGQISDKNLETLINQIRRQSGLAPVQHPKMDLNHLFLPMGSMRIGF